jgi:hypothetical protein
MFIAGSMRSAAVSLLVEHAEGFVSSRRKTSADRGKSRVSLENSVRVPGLPGAGSGFSKRVSISRDGCRLQAAATPERIDYHYSTPLTAACVRATGCVQALAWSGGAAISAIGDRGGSADSR